MGYYIACLLTKSILYISLFFCNSSNTLLPLLHFSLLGDFYILTGKNQEALKIFIKLLKDEIFKNSDDIVKKA